MIVAIAAASSLSMLPAWSDVTNTDIVNAVYSARVLDPGTSVRVRADGDRVFISAYRNPAENDDDCRINTVIIAKSVLATTGDSVARVTVYYYGTDGTSYAEVSVTAGDVKAYASGSTSQEQLLKSIVVEHKKQLSVADTITSRLANSQYLRPDYRVDLKSDTDMVVTSVLGDWVPEPEVKLEAVKIANIAAQSAPSTVQQIKVSFMDPASQTNRREVSFKKDDAQDIWAKVQAAINGVQIAKVVVPVELKNMTARNGAALEERATLLNRIKDGDRLGMGMTQFIKAFMQIEAMVPSGDEAAIKTAVMKLHENLNDLEKQYKLAKETKFAKIAGEDENTGGRHSNNELGNAKIWFKGKKPFPPSTIATNPDGVISIAENLCGGAGAADHDPDFLHFLAKVSEILKADKNNGGAAKVDARMAKMRNGGVR
jgi:hypothetical protein